MVLYGIILFIYYNYYFWGGGGGELSVILFSRAIITSHCAYGEMSGHQNCKVTVFFFF